MGIFQKISTVFKSNINDLIARAENPEKMLNQIILDMKAEGKPKTDAVCDRAPAKRGGRRGVPLPANDQEQYLKLAYAAQSVPRDPAHGPP